MCNNSLSFAQRGLLSEDLPRWLSITVNGKQINLPDPIFHEGQYQKFGKRLPIPVDITEGVLSNLSTSGASKHLIQVAWINAPLDDCGKPLLEAVMLGHLTPECVSLLSLPLIQITLDHKRSLSSLVDEFHLPLEEDVGPTSYLKRELATDSITMQIFSSSPAHDIWGLYDFCIPATHVIPMQDVRQKLTCKLKTGCGPNELICDDDWLHLSTLCPLTRTRIQLPVRGFDCLHLDCFDLSNYLIINKKRPRWKCPICSNGCPFRHLRRDDLMQKILAEADPAVTGFQLHSDGHWVFDKPEVRSGGKHDSPSDEEEESAPTCMKVPKLENETMPQIVRIASEVASAALDSCITLSSDEEEATVSSPPSSSVPANLTSVLPVASINSSSVRPQLVLQAAPIVRPNSVPLLRLPPSWVPMNPFMTTTKLVQAPVPVTAESHYRAAVSTFKALPKTRQRRRKKLPQEPVVDLTLDLDSQSQPSVDEEEPKDAPTSKDDLTIPFDQIPNVGSGKSLLGLPGSAIVGTEMIRFTYPWRSRQEMSVLRQLQSNTDHKMLGSMVKLSDDRLSVLSAHDGRILLEMKKAKLLINQRFKEEQQSAGPDLQVDPELIYNKYIKDLYCNVSLNFVKFVLSARQVGNTLTNEEMAIMEKYEAKKIVGDSSKYCLPGFLETYKQLKQTCCWPLTPSTELATLNKTREAEGIYNSYQLLVLANGIHKLCNNKHKLFLNEYEAWAIVKRLERETNHDPVIFLPSLKRSYANIGNRFVACVLSNCDKCYQNSAKDASFHSMFKSLPLNSDALNCFDHSPSPYSSALPSESSLASESKADTEEEFLDDSSVTEIDDKSVDEPFKSLTTNDLKNLPKSLKKYMFKTEEPSTQWNKSYLKWISFIQHNAFTPQIYCRPATLLNGQEMQIMKSVRAMLSQDYDMTEKSLLDALNLKPEEMFWTRTREMFMQSVFNFNTDRVPDPVPEEFSHVMPNSYRLTKLQASPLVFKLVFQYNNRLLVNNVEMIELIKFRDEHHKHPGMEETYQLIKEMYHNCNRKIVRNVKAACTVCCSKFLVIREARTPSLPQKISDAYEDEEGLTDGFSMEDDMFSFKYGKRLWPRELIQEVVAVLDNEFALAPRLKDNHRYLENIKCNYYYSWTPFLSKGSESENSAKTDEIPYLMERRSDRVLVSAEDAEDIIMKAHISFNHVQTSLLHHNLCKNYANITQRMIAQTVERNCESCLRIWAHKFN